MCTVDWKLLLEYLKVVVSWPGITLVLGLILILFRQLPSWDSIIASLKRIRSAKIGGAEIVLHDQPKPKEEEPPAARPAGSSTGSDDGVADENRESAQAIIDSNPIAQKVLEFIKKSPEESTVEIMGFVESLNFERIFQPIYGTQIAALTYLAGTQGASVENLHFFLDLHRERKGTAEWSAFVSYLVISGLLVENVPAPGMCTITDRGKAFLAYIQRVYPVYWEQKGL